MSIFTKLALYESKNECARTISEDCDGTVSLGETDNFTLLTILAFEQKLEDTALYPGLLLVPAEGFGLQSRLFLPIGQKTA